MNTKDLIAAFVRKNRGAILEAFSWGDGRGGYILSIIAEELGMAGDAITETKASGRSAQRNAKKAVRRAVFSIHGDQCLSCGATEHICIDHVIPLVKGGENTIENMQPLCRSCNSSKGTKANDYRAPKDGRA